MIENTLMKDVVDPPAPEDTGGGAGSGGGEPLEAERPILEEECFEPFTVYQGVGTPGWGWADYTEAACVQSFDLSEPFGTHFGFIGHKEVYEYRLYGYSQVNMDNAPARLAAATTHGSGWDDGVVTSDDSEVIGNGDWAVIGDPGTMGNLNYCTPECELMFFSEVQDMDRVNADTCDEYDPTEVCMTWDYRETSRRAPMYSTCEPGSGRFYLVPTHAVNRDGDTNLSLALAPIMASGVGRMTAAAWITSVEVVEDQGQSLRAIKSGAGYHFEDDDALADAALVSRTVLATGVTTFNPGIVNGATRFIVQEAPETIPATLEVDLTWTCGALQAHETILAPQGYTFELADLGCPVVWPQAFTFRLAPTLLPDRLQIEAYGSVADSFDAPLTTTPAGYEFNFVTGPLRARGTVVSASANQGAVVDMEEVSWSGIPACLPGTYTLPGEE